MQIRTIDDRLSVGGQIRPDDVAELKARGFRSIICNRPDDEDHGQPPFAEIADAARAQGLEARHIPVSGRPGGVQSTAFARALDELPGPVFAYCRSGGRAGALAAMSGR